MADNSTGPDPPPAQNAVAIAAIFPLRFIFPLEPFTPVPQSSLKLMHMAANSATEEIARLTKRLEQLQESAENELRQKLKEARAVVTDLEMQLSSITGRPSATMIKAADPKRWASITDEQLEVMILFLFQKEGQDGMNAKTIGERLNQNPLRIRQWIKKYPTLLRRVGSGPGTKFFAA